MTAELLVYYGCSVDLDHVHAKTCPTRPPLLLVITEDPELVELFRSELEAEFQGYTIERIWRSRDIEGRILTDWDRVVVLGSTPPSGDLMRTLRRTANHYRRFSAPRGRRAIDLIQWRMSPIDRKARP